jgi:ribosomal protein S18 acetylase RimI-like enzyme
MSLPDHVRRFWAAMDDLMAEVHPTPWGAVITDGRFPRIWDANYARLDAPRRVPVHEVEAALLPRLAAVEAPTMHVVSLHHESHTSLLAELSSRGHRLVWDLVMERTDEVDVPREVVEALAADDELWERVAASLALFGDESDEAVAQLRAIEREVMSPGGKIWFGIRDDQGTIVALAAVLLLGDVGYIDNVATFPQARPRGYATALTDHAARAARARGARHVILLADPDDPSAVGIYRRLGFREVGRLASTRGPVPR